MSTDDKAEQRELKRQKEKDLAEVRTNVAPNRKKKFLPSAEEVQRQIAEENAGIDEASMMALEEVGRRFMDKLHHMKAPPKDVRVMAAYWNRQYTMNKRGNRKPLNEILGMNKRTMYVIIQRYRETQQEFDDELREVLRRTPLYIKGHLARMKDSADIYSQTGANSQKVMNEWFTPRDHQRWMINNGVVNQQFGGQQQNIVAPAQLEGKTPEEMDALVEALDRGEVIDVEAE